MNFNFVFKVESFEMFDMKNEVIFTVVTEVYILSVYTSMCVN